MMKNLRKLSGFLKDKKNRKKIIIVLVLLSLLLGGFYFLKREGRVFVDDSLVQAPVINITSPTTGNLNEVDVIEGQSVKNGDLLAIVGTQSLRAQTDGIVISANKQIGSLVGPQTNVVSLVNPNDFRIVGTLDENKGLKDIRVGQIVRFSVDAFPGKSFWGYVDEVSPSSKQTQISFSISSERPTQQFQIFVRYNWDKYPELKNGMSAKMTIFTNTN